jgi:hypothetical protein
MAKTEKKEFENSNVGRKQLEPISQFQTRGKFDFSNNDVDSQCLMRSVVISSR